MKCVLKMCKMKEKKSGKGIFELFEGIIQPAIWKFSLVQFVFIVPI